MAPNPNPANPLPADLDALRAIAGMQPRTMPDHSPINPADFRRGPLREDHQRPQAIDPIAGGAPTV